MNEKQILSMQLIKTLSKTLKGTTIKYKKNSAAKFSQFIPIRTLVLKITQNKVSFTIWKHVQRIQYNLFSPEYEENGTQSSNLISRAR